MWLLFMLAWLGFLALVLVFAQQAFGYDLARLSAFYSDLPPTQRLAAGAVLFMALSLVAATVFQAYRISRQQGNLKLLRDRLRGAREDAIVAHAVQSHLDATVKHLVESNPAEAISALQDKLTETEQRALVQQGRNEASDMHDQLAEIRQRQQALRETVGAVAEKRRAVEPVFTELRDRQYQLERSLVDIETDDKKNSIADRLKDLNFNISAVLARVKAAHEAFDTLNRFKEELAKSQAELGPLRAPEAGVNALVDELRLSRDQLAKTLDELESNGNEPLSARVEALSRSKLELQQRVARVEDCFNILNAIRLDFEELGDRQGRLERSLAEVETDANGKTLTDRQNALNEFVVQSRLRLSALQDTLATLNGFKDELAKSQADLVTLQAPVFGIEALIGDVQKNRDLLVRTLGEIEKNGDAELDSRVEALSRSKREIDERIAKVFESFTALDSMRKDIGGIFVTIRNTLNRIG